ncbi:hypothetical protein Tco_0961512, partial [Tanacetum coccineum]
DSYLTDGTLEKPIDWIPGMSNIRYKDIPSFIRTTDRDDIMFDFMGEEAKNNLNASAIIFNTFDALEHKVLEAMASKFKYSNIYTIGPVRVYAGQANSPNGPHKAQANHSSPIESFQTKQAIQVRKGQKSPNGS